jgi:hypothetical protein
MDAKGIINKFRIVTNEIKIWKTWFIIWKRKKVFYLCSEKGKRLQGFPGNGAYG